MKAGASQSFILVFGSNQNHKLLNNHHVVLSDVTLTTKSLNSSGKCLLRSQIKGAHGSFSHLSQKEEDYRNDLDMLHSDAACPKSPHSVSFIVFWPVNSVGYHGDVFKFWFHSCCSVAFLHMCLLSDWSWRVNDFDLWCRLFHHLFCESLSTRCLK